MNEKSSLKGVKFNSFFFFKKKSPKIFSGAYMYQLSSLLPSYTFSSVFMLLYSVLALWNEKTENNSISTKSLQSINKSLINTNSCSRARERGDSRKFRDNCSVFVQPIHSAHMEFFMGDYFWTVINKFYLHFVFVSRATKFKLMPFNGVFFLPLSMFSALDRTLLLNTRKIFFF